MAMIFCPSCNMGISGAAPFCPHCGSNLDPKPPRKRPPSIAKDGTVICPECGDDEIPSETVMCRGCGYPLRPGEVERLVSQRRRSGRGCAFRLLVVVVVGLIVLAVLVFYFSPSF